MQLVLENQRIATNVGKQIEFGNKIGIWGALFGCWHKNISRPFTIDRQSYFVCLDCGARQPFNPQTFETESAFYFPPDIPSQKLT